jgi:hypothetical protein
MHPPIKCLALPTSRDHMLGMAVTRRFTLHSVFFDPLRVNGSYRRTLGLRFARRRASVNMSMQAAKTRTDKWERLR